MSRGYLLAWALTLALLLPWKALAQPAPADAGVARQDPGDTQDRAGAAFIAAMEAWRRGDCTGAAAGFGRAMELSPHPHTRYNLARALECAPDIPRAIEEYGRFLAETTDPADRADVERRVLTLRARPVEVFVTSEPLDANVTVVGEAVHPARTPCRILLAPGAHAIVIDHPGFRQAVQHVVVEVGVPQDVQVNLEALPATTPPPVVPVPPDRILVRRADRRITGRVGLLSGFSVPRDRAVFAIGVEGGLFYRRSLALQAHALWIDTDGSPFVVGADLGWVFVLDEVDLGLFVTGAALFQCDASSSCREATFRRDSEQFIGGFAVRADVVVHPRIGVGLWGRGSWRNFDLSDSEGLLVSGGLSVSLFL